MGYFSGQDFSRSEFKILISSAKFKYTYNLKCTIFQIKIVAIRKILLLIKANIRNIRVSVLRVTFIKCIISTPICKNLPSPPIACIRTLPWLLGWDVLLNNLRKKIIFANVNVIASNSVRKREENNKNFCNKITRRGHRDVQKSLRNKTSREEPRRQTRSITHRRTVATVLLVPCSRHFIRRKSLMPRLRKL